MIFNLCASYAKEHSWVHVRRAGALLTTVDYKGHGHCFFALVAFIIILHWRRCQQKISMRKVDCEISQLHFSLDSQTISVSPSSISPIKHWGSEGGVIQSLNALSSGDHSSVTLPTYRTNNSLPLTDQFTSNTDAFGSFLVSLQITPLGFSNWNMIPCQNCLLNLVFKHDGKDCANEFAKTLVGAILWYWNTGGAMSI